MTGVPETRNNTVASAVNAQLAEQEPSGATGLGLVGAMAALALGSCILS